MAVVSVLMPVYNVEEYLVESIESILNQTYTDFKFFIINDGSIDGSENIILRYNDPRIEYIKNTVNQGYIKCLNQAIGLVDTKYIIRMDSDDIALPTRIEKQVAYMEENPSVVVCGSSRINFYPEKHREDILMPAITDRKKLLVNSIFNTSLHHPSVIIRTETVKKNNLRYKEQYYYAEDKALWLDLSEYGELANIEEALLRYRIHYNQVSYLYKPRQKSNSVDRTFDFLLKKGFRLEEKDLPALMKICYERNCDTNSELEQVESLALRLIKESQELGLPFHEEFKKNIRHRVKLIFIRSSRIGVKILKPLYKSTLVSFYHMDFMFYIKVGVRTFGKFEINDYN
jgi:glycosyltransferase involved in cell wall biosynthesis